MLPFQASKFSLSPTGHKVAPERDQGKQVSKHRQPGEATRQLTRSEGGSSFKDRRAGEELREERTCWAPTEQEVLFISEGLNWIMLEVPSRS